MPEKLPEGWVETTLGEIAMPSHNRALPMDVPEMRYIGLEHISSQTMQLIGYGHGGEVRSTSARFSKGDVLYGKMRPYLNKVWVAEFGGLCSTEFLVFRKRDDLNSQFLGLRLNADDFVAFANGQVSGERPRVDFDKLSRFPIFLPPIAEQERIVVKLSSALLKVRRAELAAGRAVDRLQHYRTSLLEAAVAGELTRAWRKAKRKYKKQSGTIAEALLQRHFEAHRTQWEKAEFKRLLASGKAPKHDQWKSRYVRPSLPDTTHLPKLPKSWVWASLEIVAELSSGISVSQNRLVKDPIELPYLRVANVLRGHFDLTEIKTIRVEKDRVSNYLLHAGDILFNEGGDRDKLGRGWVWEGQIPKCLHQNHVFCARLIDPTLVISKLVSHWGNTFGQRFFLEHGKQTTNLASINRSILGRLPVPIAPIDEQTEILRQVTNRLTATDRLASTLDRQLKRAFATRQSLLSEAFAGRLVPQNPNNEPASILLERIRTENVQGKLEQKRATLGFSSTSTKRSHFMQQQPTLPKSLSLTWERIGRKTDARRLFDEAGFGPESVVQFYEALRATPEVLGAFQAAARKQQSPQRPAKVTAAPHTMPQGRFRLIELWLEDFKNLKDYTVVFDPAHGLDVVLGWNGTGKSNFFEALVIIFRDLYDWWERNRWPDKPMNAYRISYEIEQQIVEVTWHPARMKRPELKMGLIPRKGEDKIKPVPIKRDELLLPRFVFGYYSGPTNRLAEHFLPMTQAHYERLRDAEADDAKTLASLLEQRRFFCAETHHAKYVLLAFSYKEDSKINEFLTNRLRIVGFESALFVIRKPRWAKQGSKAEDFWGAKGIMRRVMERLRCNAIAPIVLEQKVSYGYRTTTEDHYYFLLPDTNSLHSFAAEYPDARTFFLALESTDFSELIHDVKIQVQVKSTNTEQVPITFHQLSEGEQQLLMVLGLMRFTKSHQSLVLLDEPDTHLNPHWSVDYLKDLTRVMSDTSLESPEQQSSQILVATHDPLVIASLVKEQVHLLKRNSETGGCKWVPATVNPRGLGFTGILTSDMFGFRSDLDPETLGDLDNRVRLVAKEGSLSRQEKGMLEQIDKRLLEAGFLKAFSDPYYAAFIRAWGQRHSELMAGEQFLSPEKKQEVDRIAREVLKEAVAEVEKENASNAIR
jgi:restriction endonuclease S subunit/energy-coupling factor transporter ATP-binding protein EcfA2